MSVLLRSLRSHLPLRNLQMFCRTRFTGCSKLPLLLGHRKSAPVYFLQANWTPRWLQAGHVVSAPPSQHESSEKFRLIYRFPGIQFCRSLSRLKLLQTTLTFLFLPPIYYYFLQGQVTYSFTVYCTGTALFAGVMLYFFSYYLRRIVGMMYLNADGTILKVSHLTFWGKRRDLFIPVEDVKTLSETGDHKHETLSQLQRYSTSDKLYFTTRFGHVLDTDKFIPLFGKFK